MAKYLSQSEHDRCVGCGVCKNACPKEAITIHHGLWSEVESEKCIGCGLCVKACPAGVMHKIEREAV